MANQKANIDMTPRPMVCINNDFCVTHLTVGKHYMVSMTTETQVYVIHDMGGIGVFDKSRFQPLPESGHEEAP